MQKYATYDLRDLRCWQSSSVPMLISWYTNLHRNWNSRASNLNSAGRLVVACYQRSWLDSPCHSAMSWRDPMTCQKQDGPSVSRSWCHTIPPLPGPSLHHPPTLWSILSNKSVSNATSLFNCPEAKETENLKRSGNMQALGVMKRCVSCESVEVISFFLLVPKWL